VAAAAAARVLARSPATLGDRRLGKQLRAAPGERKEVGMPEAGIEPARF
jgi:hypothetical protein